MKRLNRTAFILKVVCVTGIVCLAGAGCMAPLYHTAEVTPGYELSVGAGPTFYGYYTGEIDGSNDFEEVWGTHYDAALRYAPSERLAFTAYASPINKIQRYHEGERAELEDIPWVPLAGAGIQYEFVENPALAFQLMAEVPDLASLEFLAGLPIKGREVATLRLAFKPVVMLYEETWMPPTVTLAFHPTQNLHFYAGVNPLFLADKKSWELSAGVGYTIWRKK